MDNYIFAPSYTFRSTTSNTAYIDNGVFYYTSTATPNTTFNVDTWNSIARSVAEVNGIIDDFSEAVDARPNIDDLKIDEEDLEKFLSEG